MKKPPFQIKVNLLTLIKWARKIWKWRRKKVIENNKEDVPEKPI